MPIEENALDQIATDIQPFDKGTSLRDVHGLLETHRHALREVSGDAQRTAERLERMLPEMEKKMAAAKAEAGARYVPLGDADLVDARYVMPDGSVRLGKSTEKYTLPDGSEDEYVRQGLLTDRPVTREQDEAQRAYAGLALAYQRASRYSRKGANPWTDPLVKRSFRHFRKTMMAIPGKTGAYLRKLFTEPELMKRAVSNTSGSGGELVAVPTIAIVRRPADLARRVVGLIRVIEVPASSFKRPVVTGRALAKKRGSITDDPARYPVRTFTTSDDTVTVVNQELTALLDPLWVTETSNILEDPMSLVNDWLMRGWGDSWEISYLHGDTAGSHQDAIASWTLGSYFTAGDLDGTNSPLKWWIGLRARAVNDSKTVSAGGTWDASDHFGAIELLGNHAGGRVVSITGLHCLYTQLLDYDKFLTLDAFGQRATLITGEIGSIGGVPVIISEFMSDDFDSSSGLFTGSNSSSEIVYTNADAWTYYEHTPGSDDFDVSYPERGAQYVGGVRRGVLSPTCIDAETPASVLYNL